MPHHLVDVRGDTFICCGVFQGVSGRQDLFGNDCCWLLPLVLKSTVSRLDGPGAEDFLFEGGEGVGVPFHGDVAEALRDVGFDFLFATECDSVLGALDKMVDTSDVGIGTYLDDVSLAFQVIESWAEDADLLR